MSTLTKHARMTTLPVGRLVLGLAAPTIVANLISSLYNMADTYFVGGLGTSATAGVGVVFAVMNIIQAIGFFFGQGSGNFISRALGAQEQDSANVVASIGFFSSLLAGGLVMAGGLLFLEPLARLLGATETILPHACDYMRYILIGAPFMASSHVLSLMLRFQGNAVYSMLGMVSGAVLNVGLDALFILVFHLGVAGAAIATLISQIFSFLLLLYGCSRGDSIRISLRNFRPSVRHYLEIGKGGLPSLCSQSLASVATISLNQAAKLHGDAVIAAISIVNRILMLANGVVFGFTQGFQPFCGFNYGAKRYDRVRQGFWFCVRTLALLLVALVILLALFAPQLIRQFRDDPAVLEVGVRSLRLQCLAFPLTGWIVLTNMTLQTLGRAFQASFTSLMRQGLFLLPLLAFLAPRFGVLGIQLSQPLANLITFSITLPLGLRLLRSLPETPPELLSGLAPPVLE
ncbi:MAG: MATE family efflux transporter [Clostridiales bacterium]|nr:MATE family efflux transporter [Clostridiales bacterium]